jgi:hypothetical protein
MFVALGFLVKFLLPAPAVALASTSSVKYDQPEYLDLMADGRDPEPPLPAPGRYG